MIKVVAINKKARFEYELKESFSAGMLLSGSEVKSLREARCHLKDSYISFIRGEVFLQKAHISPYKKARDGGHEPERLRKLLLRQEEIKRIKGLLEQKGMSCIPLKIYFKKGLAKLDLAIGVGKSKGDKRHSLKKKQTDREIQRALKKSKEN